MANVLPVEKQVAVSSARKNATFVLDLIGHPQATKVYAWAHDTDDPKDREGM